MKYHGKKRTNIKVKMKDLSLISVKWINAYFSDWRQDYLWVGREVDDYWNSMVPKLSWIFTDNSRTMSPLWKQREAGSSGAWIWRWGRTPLHSGPACAHTTLTNGAVVRSLSPTITTTKAKLYEKEVLRSSSAESNHYLSPFSRNWIGMLLLVHLCRADHE